MPILIQDLEYILSTKEMYLVYSEKNPGQQHSPTGIKKPLPSITKYFNGDAIKKAVKGFAANLVRIHGQGAVVRRGLRASEQAQKAVKGFAANLVHIHGQGAVVRRGLRASEQAQSMIQQAEGAIVLIRAREVEAHLEQPQRSTLQIVTGTLSIAQRPSQITLQAKYDKTSDIHQPRNSRGLKRGA
ncbi:hypothetical protein TELCIR_14317, partial [Teladorsagia circumcincta]